MLGEEAFRRVGGLGKAKKAVKNPGVEWHEQSSVREDARREHVAKLVVVASMLLEQLEFSSPDICGSWVPPQGTHPGARPRWTTAYDDQPDAYVIWQPEKTSAGTLTLAVENERYFPHLKDDLPDDALSVPLESLKRRIAEYFWACRQLVEAIVDRCPDNILIRSD